MAARQQQSYVNGASEAPLIGETIGRFFDDACAKWASRPALIVRHQQVRLSYGERFKVVLMYNARRPSNRGSGAMALSSGVAVMPTHP